MQRNGADTSEKAAEIRFRVGVKWRIGERPRRLCRETVAALFLSCRGALAVMWFLGTQAAVRTKSTQRFETYLSSQRSQCGLCRNFTDYLKRKQTLAPRSTHLFIHNVLCIVISGFQIPHPENGILTGKHGGGSIMMCACRNTESAGRF